MPASKEEMLLLPRIGKSGSAEMLHRRYNRVERPMA
jgi:hypothetical protein